MDSRSTTTADTSYPVSPWNFPPGSGPVSVATPASSSTAIEASGPSPHHIYAASSFAPNPHYPSDASFLAHHQSLQSYLRALNSDPSSIYDRLQHYNSLVSPENNCTEAEKEKEKTGDRDCEPLKQGKKDTVTTTKTKMPSKGNNNAPSSNAAQNATLPSPSAPSVSQQSTPISQHPVSASAKNSDAKVTARHHSTACINSNSKSNPATGGGRQTPTEKPSNAELLPPKASLPTRSSHLQSQNATTHSNSVPSTPNQHGRNFSFESRDPSPNAATNHSPRSAYSETNPSLPSLRPLPPRDNSCPYETAQFNSRRRIPYNKGSDPLEKIDLDKVKSELTPAEDEKLTGAVMKLYSELVPKPENEARRTMLMNKLERLFNEEWPGHDIRVHLFGSSGNLLCSDDSDVDICITTTWKEMEDVCKIAGLLANRGMEKVVCISAAKVPIVKIWDPELRLACDMNVNNTLALDNTRMVRTYVDMDDRIRPLAMAIKHWTRRRIINDAAFGGTLSSYTWICLIIAFLQLREPPVVPSLHNKKYPRLPRKAGASESPFADDIAKMRGFGKNNKSSVGSLLFQFFRFYGHEFDYNKFVLSVRQGQPLTKKHKNWQHSLNNQLCVEEPFNTSRNLGNTADEYSFRGLHEEIRRAFDLVSEAKLDECCEQYVFPKEEERPAFTRQTFRPVMMRSSSQSHSGSRGGRGGHGGRGRHSNNMRNGGSNRRSSTATYDQAGGSLQQQQQQQQQQQHAQSQAQAQLFMTQGMPPDLQWYSMDYNMFMNQAAHAQLFAQNLYPQQMVVLPQASQQTQTGQQPSMSQTPHGQGQQTNQQHHRLQSSTASSSNERSRTNSVDAVSTPAASMFPMIWAMYTPGMVAAAYPQTPSVTSTPTASTPMELRRGMNRASISSQADAVGSSLRSQSQPASRPTTAQSASPSGAYMGPVAHIPGQASLGSRLNGSGSLPPLSIPAYLPIDDGADNSTPTPKANPEIDRNVTVEADLANGSSYGIPSEPIIITSASDVLPPPPPPVSARRKSSDIHMMVDRRMRREKSRSPSPMGTRHRALSASGGGIATMVASSPPLQQNMQQLSSSQTLAHAPIIKGSLLKTSTAISQTQPSQAELSSTSESPTPLNEYDSSLGLGIRNNAPSATPTASVTSTPIAASTPASIQSPGTLPVSGPPPIVNGTNAVPVALCTTPFADDGHMSRVPTHMPYYHMMQTYEYPQHGQMAFRSSSMLPQVSAISPSDMGYNMASSASQQQQQSHQFQQTLSPLHVAQASSQPSSQASPLADLKQSSSDLQSSSQALSPVYEHKSAIPTPTASKRAEPITPTTTTPMVLPANSSVAPVAHAQSSKPEMESNGVTKSELAKKGPSGGSDSKSNSRGNNGGKQNTSGNGNQSQGGLKTSTGKKSRNASDGPREGPTAVHNNSTVSNHSDKDSELASRNGNSSHYGTESSKQWSRQKSRKKGGSSSEGKGQSQLSLVSPNAEQPPKDDAERKGG
ncbi:Poly(A) RNA polymerase cid13 [Ceratocystis fimbriata CBS 114723]|uniref:polynucleotide adenylyltransferase n=1 Tax=Ceratocystis fimbriata CBS 114723 TaxID=1035309 RepID=A0A2C5X7F1_9PEZI|nr:Poly(A) RNA polymerase cid13 [Ceratocystis fimbriata CBS 114723]